MIKLVEIIKDNEELRQLKKAGSAAKKAAAQLLGKAGLESPGFFVLRIKEMPKYGTNWVASYRTHTIMNGRPIFWINHKLPEIIRRADPGVSIVRVMTDSIIHEWWHAICEAFRIHQFRNVPLKTKVGFQPDHVEEEMAEKFIAFCGGDIWKDVSEKEAKYFKHAIQEFNGLWR
jgi:hypothetical protein